MKTGFDRVKDWPEGWHAIARSAEIGRLPVAVSAFGLPLVLWRHEDGLSLFPDRCPHRNAPLSEGDCREGTLSCPYHGWRFSPNGACVAMPGRAGLPRNSRKHALPAIPVREDRGLVFAAASRPEEPPYRPPCLERGRYHDWIWQTDLPGTLVNVAENFLDGLHTHFVHHGLVRRESGRQTVTASLHSGRDRVSVDYSGETGQNGWISRLYEPRRASSHARFILPAIAELEYRSANRVELLIAAHLTPLDNRSIRAFARVILPGSRITAPFKYLALKPFFRKVLDQDRSILALQQATIDKFGGEDFQSTKLDLVRPRIEELLAQGRRDRASRHREITVEL